MRLQAPGKHGHLGQEPCTPNSAHGTCNKPALSRLDPLLQTRCCADELYELGVDLIRVHSNSLLVRNRRRLSEVASNFRQAKAILCFLRGETEPN